MIILPCTMTVPTFAGIVVKIGDFVASSYAIISALTIGGLAFSIVLPRIAPTFNECVPSVLVPAERRTCEDPGTQSNYHDWNRCAPENVCTNLVALAARVYRGKYNICSPRKKR